MAGAPEGQEVDVAAQCLRDLAGQESAITQVVACRVAVDEHVGGGAGAEGLGGEAEVFCFQR